MGREIPTKSSHRRQVIQRINISGNQHCRTCLNPGRLWRFERQDPVHALVVEVDAGAATGLAISIRYGTSLFDAAIKKINSPRDLDARSVRSTSLSCAGDVSWQFGGTGTGKSDEVDAS
jgi:hypothetical protein